VEMMNGNIWVESEPEKGSKFIFTVSLKSVVEDNKKKFLNDINWKNISIFVADDEPEIREFFLNISEIWGISCTVADSVETAAAMIQEKSHNYNIYFINCYLPGMNVVDLILLIKRKEGKNLIVIISSSFDRILIEAEAGAAGVNKFISGPLFPSVIVDTINEFIGVKSATEQNDDLDYMEDFSGYTILLAEDVDINREIVITLLEPTLITVDCAENGAKAFDMFTKTPEKYDMILMDIQMPEMDGYEATRQIRAFANPKAKTIPIIAMTANVFREDIEKCMSTGMNGHVGKPININEVISQMRLHLKPRE